MPGLVAIEDPPQLRPGTLKRAVPRCGVAAVSQKLNGRLPCFIVAGFGMRRSPDADAQIFPPK
jgi:hypothetical protein